LQALDAARVALRDAAADDAAERRPAPPNPHAAAPLAAVSEPPGTTPAAPPGDKPATWAAAPVQPAVVPLSPPNARQRALAWAGAMTDVAVEFAQGLDRLPPAGRRADIARIGILSEAARRLSQGDAPNRADLLSSTWLAGGPQDQASSASSAKLATSTPDLSGQDLCSPSRSSDAGSRIPKIVNPA
jgi:hypothetical protein